MPDGEMMIVSEVRTKMCVVDTAHLLFVPRLIVVLFLPHVVVFVPIFVSVLVLSEDSQSPS